MSDDILMSIDDAVVTLTLNRPDKRNAMRLAMWRGLDAMLQDLRRRSDVRALILTGAGGNFCAGADIAEFAEVRADVQSARIYEDATEAATRALRDFPRPTIAAVSGYGVGGGCGLALACDIRVGDQTTQMGIPAARLGIIYGALDCGLLYRQVGLARAKLVLYSGRFFPVAECARMGLVDVVAETDALQRARELAADLAGNAPLTLQASKLVLEALDAGRAEEREADILALMDAAIASADYREGGRAFLEKRQPVFVGR